MRVLRLFSHAALVALALGAANQSAAQSQQEIGKVTQLPLPRYVSLKTNEAYARRGPGKTHRIDWKFVRRGMPLKVISEYGHWRRVEDAEGKGGWIHYALLSRIPTVIIINDGTEVYAKPQGRSRLIAKLQGGVVGKLLECEGSMCDVETADPEGVTYRGWVAKSNLWGLQSED